MTASTSRRRRTSPSGSCGSSSAPIDAVYLVYNEFKSAITQKTTVALLPLSKAPPAKEGAVVPTLLFEPNERAVLGRLVPMCVEILIDGALLERRASEHGARMTTMDAAMRDPKEMIGRLTLRYNRAGSGCDHEGADGDHRGAEALKD